MGARPEGVGPLSFRAWQLLEGELSAGGVRVVSAPAEIVTTKPRLPIDSGLAGMYVTRVAIQHSTGSGPIPVDDEMGEGR